MSRRLDQQNQEKLEKEKDEIEDLLSQAMTIVQTKRRRTVAAIGAVGFLFAVGVNYVSFGLDGYLQKGLGAVALVAVPWLFSAMTSWEMKKNDIRKRKEAFELLIKQRRNLEKASYDYQMDYEGCKANRVSNLAH
jgi:hypothetical protein